LSIWSCSKVKSYSDIPEIHFVSLTFKEITHEELAPEKKAVVCFSVIDGDGDLGVRTQDMGSPGNRVSRIHYTWFEKTSGDNYKPYIFVNDSTSNYSSEIPYNEVMDKSEAQNKTLKGIIDIALDVPLDPNVDTMYVKFYIVDRKKHVSNNDSTPPFSIYTETGAVIKSRK
jgi:hypothetical protein